MNSELKQIIDDISREILDSEAFSEEEVGLLWKNLLGLYRLRLHEGYLIKMDRIFLEVTNTLESECPVCGGRLSKFVEKVVKSEQSQGELLNEIYPELGIDFRMPITNREKELVLLIEERLDGNMSRSDYPQEIVKRLMMPVEGRDE